MNTRLEFDPYHKWLGIPSSEQPPNHYRLLRINLFESDAEVIENAYVKEMQALKEQEHGQHVDHVESISRELIAARNCLHDAEDKAAYDAGLRGELNAEERDDEQAADQAQRAAIDEAVQSATVGLIDEREQLQQLTDQASARQRQALLEVRRLRSKSEQLEVEEEQEGDGGTRRRGRMFALVLSIVVLTSVIWLAMGGASRLSFTEAERVPLVGSRAGQERDDNGLKMQFCWCPPGKFAMGSPKDEPGRGAFEAQVVVTLTRGFWLGKHEVTQGQWEQVMGSKPWSDTTNVKEGTDYPATYFSWDEAMEFCRKLTEQERSSGRLPADWQYTLPTEAQWEFACRAGTSTRFSFGDDESKLGDFVWCDQSTSLLRERYAHQVGLKKSNAWGLCDMHGNVYEWCRDWYQEKLPGGTNPEVTSGGSDRVYRGGAWGLPPSNCRSAFRYYFDLSKRGSAVGIRVTLSSVK